jgi:hypothetical protein
VLPELHELRLDVEDLLVEEAGTPCREAVVNRPLLRELRDEILLVLTKLVEKELDRGVQVGRVASLLIALSVMSAWGRRRKTWAFICLFCAAL